MAHIYMQNFCQFMLLEYEKLLLEKIFTRANLRIFNYFRQVSCAKRFRILFDTKNFRFENTGNDLGNNIGVNLVV